VIKSTLQCADERPTTTEVEIEVSAIDAVRKCRGSLRFECFSILFVYMNTKCCAVSIGSPAARLQRRVRRVDVGVTQLWNLVAFSHCYRVVLSKTAAAQLGFDSNVKLSMQFDDEQSSVSRSCR
jgi:hypothetical protein